MEKLKLEYSTACRSCMELMPLKTITTIEVDNLEPWLMKPEYDMMMYLENLRKHQGEKCINCGSSNMEVLDIKSIIGPFYDFRRLAMLHQTGNMENFYMLNITKSMGPYIVNQGGNDYASPNFIKECILKMKETINSLSDDYFKDYYKGSFFMCLSFNNNGRGKFLSIEKLRLHGMTRNEILSELNRVLRNI